MRRAPLLCLLLTFASVTAGSAQSTIHYDFEDGRTRGKSTAAKQPPRVLIEQPGAAGARGVAGGENSFMRITGSAGDKQSVPAKYPHRNRSTVMLTSSASSMPLLSDTNRHQTYRADIRFHDDNKGTDGVVFELFQGAPGGESGGYGARNGNGPVFICWRRDGHVACRHNYANETKSDPVDLGFIPAGRWHTYTVSALWSNNPRVGRLEVSLDGTVKKRITGRGTNLGPDSNRLPAMKLGLYGDHAVGVIDVDNVRVGPPGQGPPDQGPPDEGPPDPSPEPPREVSVSAGGEGLTTAAGVVYDADAWSSGGRVERTTALVTGTADPALYQTWRYGAFSYIIPVANGDYRVTLHFAENYRTQAGQRIFSVDAEGREILSQLDVAAQVGPTAAYEVTVPVTVRDRVLSLRFRRHVGNAMVSGIRVVPQAVAAAGTP